MALSWYPTGALCRTLLLLVSLTAKCCGAADEDVLLRSDAQWETLESIHRRSVDDRISEVTSRGQFDTTVNLGYGGIFNWVDVWGPTYVCPTMEHFGTVGDGGKWVCGVDTMLQREGCIIYSFGSFADFSFEQAMLERTKCDIHVFDPTVKPSEMRSREELLNGSGRKRVTWYSLGVSDVDDDYSKLLPQCYGGLDLMYPPHPQTASARKALASTGRSLLGGLSLPRVWRPPEETQVTEATEIVTDTTEETLDTAAVTTTPDPVPVTPAVPPPPARDILVQEVIQKLQEQQMRINATSGACDGDDARKPRGIAPLPEADTSAGTVLDLEVGPHGDDLTKCRLATLPSLMKSLGHDWVDVLKMDIEGSEYATLGFVANLPNDAMRFTQLQLEMHHMWTPNPRQPNVAQFGTLADLLSHGFRTTFLEPNIYFAAQTCHELAFIKMDDCGNVVTPPLTSR